jgi:Domain of unknown function (DUF4350)
MTGRLKGLWPWLVVLALVLLVAAVSGNPRSQGPPLSPRATSPDGAKGLADLLRQLGATVNVTPLPPSGNPGGDTALILRDELTTDGRKTLMDWVRAGGTLVIADVSSNLDLSAAARQPGPLGFVLAPDQLFPECGSPAVAGVQTINPNGGILLRPRAGTQSCFPGDDHGDAYLLSANVGQGTVVELGGARLWTNGRLGRDDNSVLAANLLTPRPGTRVWWLSGPSVGGGHQSLWQLIPSRVKESLWQLLIVGALVAVWRGRRLGRPVTESPAVQIPGSELVVAVGHLLQQGHRRDQATTLLRNDLSRTLADRFGLPPTTSPGVLAEVAAARSSVDREAVLATLAGPLPADDDSVLKLAQDAGQIREEVARVR